MLFFPAIREVGGLQQEQLVLLRGRSLMIIKKC